MTPFRCPVCPPGPDGRPRLECQRVTPVMSSGKPEAIRERYSLLRCTECGYLEIPDVADPVERTDPPDEQEERWTPGSDD